jgi:hypothetical protein
METVGSIFGNFQIDYINVYKVIQGTALALESGPYEGLID